MKVLLIKDVYKLGEAGEVKKVAAGYGRNYLLPQGLAVLATPGALKQAERIRKAAVVERARMNEELGGLSEQLEGLELTFPARAGETGKLYGSVNTRMIAEAIQEAMEYEVSPQQVDTQPIRRLGVHTVPVRLTMDLIPEIKVLVHREGEAPSTAYEEEEGAEEAAAEVEEGLETVADGEPVAEADEVQTEAGTEPAGEADVELEAAEVEAGEAEELEEAEETADLEIEGQKE